MESDLPLEVLSHILSYLEPLQRLSAGLVCRRWLQVSALLLEDVCLNLIGKFKAIKTGRVFPRITLTTMLIDDDCVDFLDRIGPHLLHLRLINCSVHSKKGGVACFRLQTLEIAWTRADALLLFDTLPCLRDLDLQNVPNLNDQILLDFNKKVGPYLEVFAIPNLMMDYGPESWNCVSWKFVLKGFTVHEPDLLFCEAVEAFVARHAVTLKTLRFPKTTTPESALRFSKIPGLQLRSASFAKCDRSVVRVFPEFFRHQGGIVSLNIDNMYRLSDEQVREICRLLPELSEFSARENLYLSKENFSMFRLQNLRTLCLASCSPTASFLEDCETEKFNVPKLCTLDLTNTWLQDLSIRALLEHTPNLEELYLGNSHISNNALDHIYRRLPRLRVLSLSRCALVNDQGLRGISSLKELQKLDLSNCQSLTSEGVVESIRFLLHLRKLDLRNCPRVLSSVREKLTENNPHLTSLLLSYRIEELKNA